MARWAGILCVRPADPVRRSGRQGQPPPSPDPFSRQLIVSPLFTTRNLIVTLRRHPAFVRVLSWVAKSLQRIAIFEEYDFSAPVVQSLLP